MIIVKVPATTANNGPGVDSLGIALNLYNEFYFEEIKEGKNVIFQGCLLRLVAYIGGFAIYLLASQVFNQALAGSQATGQMICKITPFHGRVALILTIIVATLGAGIGAWRAINIEPAQSLREA